MKSVPMSRGAEISKENASSLVMTLSESRGEGVSSSRDLPRLTPVRQSGGTAETAMSSGCNKNML